MQFNKYTHTHTHTHTDARPGREEDTARLGQADARRHLVAGTQKGQISYLSVDVPVECVRLMPISVTAARSPVLSVQVLNGNQHKSNHLARNRPTKEASPIRRPNTKHSSPASCAHLKRPTKVQLPALHRTNAWFTPRRRTAFLKHLRDRYKRHAARIDMVPATSAVTFTRTSADTRAAAIEHPPDAIPPHSDGLGGEPSARNPDTPSTPAAETFNQSGQSSPSILLPWGIEDVGPMLDALDGTTLARMSLSTAKAIRQEHRMPFARSLRHALRIFCQAHNVLQVAPAGGSHNEALVTNLERATKLLHIITPALLQSSHGRCSRQGRYNEYARGELTGLIGCLVVFAGRSRQKAREDTPEARRIRASKLAHEKGGTIKVASALISPPAARRDSGTLATLRSKHPTENPAAITTGKSQAEQRAGVTAIGEQKQQANVT